MVSENPASEPPLPGLLRVVHSSSSCSHRALQSSLASKEHAHLSLLHQRICRGSLMGNLCSHTSFIGSFTRERILIGRSAGWLWGGWGCDAASNRLDMIYRSKLYRFCAVSLIYSLFWWALFAMMMTNVRLRNRSIWSSHTSLSE